LWDVDGSYRWVPGSDYRIAEVRLLHDSGTVGEVHQASRRAADNLLIRGDALNALTSLAKIPEFQREYLGRVKLAYLDPPFNTQQAFAQYDDALEHSVWLPMMRDRLVQIRRLLAQDGSLCVHLLLRQLERGACAYPVSSAETTAPFSLICARVIGGNLAPIAIGCPKEVIGVRRL
jgi:hypothetical protein